MQPEYLIAYGSFGSVLIPLTIAIIHLRRMWNNLKPLLLILVCSFLADFVSFVFIRYSLNTYLIGNIFLIGQFSLLVLIFRDQLPNPRTTNIILVASILFCIVNLTLVQGPWVFNSFSNVVASLILIAFCIVYLYRLLNDLPIIHIQNLPMLWITFAVLTYYAGNFFLFLVKNYLTYGESSFHRVMWILHNLLNVTKNILFAIALWQNYRKVRSSSLSSSAP